MAVNNLNRAKKRGQVTIFVIIAIVIVGGVFAYLLVRESFSVSNIPAEFAPIYSAYSSCIENNALNAIEIAGSQGGRIYSPDYSPGSDYAPFSSQINFMGVSVPYWYYVSGNGIIKEQAPTKAEMENEIARYILEELGGCDLSKFYSAGFLINFSTDEPDVKVSLDNSKASISVDYNLAVSKGENSALKKKHEASVSTKLGKFYDDAVAIYKKEKSDGFLENYAVDVLRLYAPVDGVEISCSPKVWKTKEVIDEIKNGLESNIAFIKLKGNYYTLKDKKQEYFVVDQSTDEQVNFIYAKNWASKFEVFGADGELMIASPIGTQEGLGVMGFCYSPYHFVYDMSFPVMVQLMEGNEIFQFPVVVVVDKNLPRKAEFSEITEDNETTNICSFSTQDINVNVYDVELNKIDANINYNCFEQQCRLGRTTNGNYEGKAPACLNGYLIARAEGYAEKKKLFSTNKDNFAEIILDREKSVEVILENDGKQVEGNAVISFDGEHSYSISLPEYKNITLSEGLYNITVFVYGNSSITIPASTKTECINAPQSGLLGLFGQTKEQCYDISLPEAKIESALIGGGKGNAYIFYSELKKGKIKIKISLFDKPDSLEKLQYNYANFDNSIVEVADE